MTDDEMSKLKRRHSARLLRMPGVAGVGVEHDDQGRPVLTVHLASDSAEVRAALPKAIEGQTVKYIVTGPYFKQ
jgi:hypothetical protein